MCQCDLRSPAWSCVNAGCHKKKVLSPFPRETRSRRIARHVPRSTVSCCAVVSEAQLGKMRDSLTPGYVVSSKPLFSTPLSAVEQFCRKGPTQLSDEPFSVGRLAHLLAGAFQHDTAATPGPVQPLLPVTPLLRHTMAVSPALTSSFGCGL